jgi:hypothetical protein
LLIVHVAGWSDGKRLDANPRRAGHRFVPK